MLCHWAKSEVSSLKGIPFGNPTWQAGKSNQNVGFNKKIAYKILLSRLDAPICDCLGHPSFRRPRFFLGGEHGYIPKNRRDETISEQSLSMHPCHGHGCRIGRML